MTGDGFSGDRKAGGQCIGKHYYFGHGQSFPVLCQEIIRVYPYSLRRRVVWKVQAKAGGAICTPAESQKIISQTSVMRASLSDGKGSSFFHDNQWRGGRLGFSAVNRRTVRRFGFGHCFDDLVGVEQGQVIANHLEKLGILVGSQGANL